MTFRVGVNVEDLERDLRDAVDGEVRFDAGTLGAYSTDGSNYRQVPLGVVVPRTPDAAAAAVRVCAGHRAPVLSRGGGTSLAGECTNTAVVLDWTKYCHAIEHVDVARRTCLVQPGVVLDVLNDHLAPTGLRFGPEPSTHPNCTIGGMLGNNSCGATAQTYGKTVDNIRRLEVVTYRGDRFWLGPTDSDEYPDLRWDAVMAAGGRRAEVYRELKDLADDYADRIREGFPHIPRRVSGYNLDSLLPEHGFHLAKAVVGSEGTCLTILRAELELAPAPKATSLVLLGYPDSAAAADAVPAILPYQPFKLEGVDQRLVDLEKTRGMHKRAMAELPDGGAWLFVSLPGEDDDDARAKAHAMAADLQRGDGSGGRAGAGGPSVHLVDDADHAAALWQVREGGLGATARPGGPAETRPDCWPGWEDSAVAPDRLGDYIRDLRGLLQRHGYQEVSLYGHFGQGCLHCRIPFDLVTAAGLETFRAFMHDAAELVVGYGGSLSGEHGDGQARGPLLETMFGPELVEAMRRFRRIWDPDGLMNPGKVVDARPLTADLRLGTEWAPADPQDLYFRYPDDDGSFQRAVLRCVGVGKCHAPDSQGRVMCPSYRATREEEHATRGRSRLLFEVLDGHADSTVSGGWRSTDVLEALDLCLACKGCRSDCPMHVDMATYKAEFLAHHYAGRLRPAAHYSMGWLPVWARLAALAPGAVNALAHTPGLDGVLKAAGGVDARRTLPRFARTRFTTWFRRLDRRGRLPRGDGSRGEVLLWPDTFTNHLGPWIGAAAVEVLEAAGFTVRIPDQELCCGLTWISTGQLGIAKKVLHRTAAALAPWTAAGTPVVGLEPSCTAVFRADAADLFPRDRDVERLRAQTKTLGELVLERAPDWDPPRLQRAAIVQMHCHQHAVLDEHADVELLRRAGVSAQVLDSGCCGLAGNFGFEAGHYDVSMRCAEDGLLPALRAASTDTVVVADGFSCRTQIDQSGELPGQGDGRRPVHVAQLLATALRHSGRPVEHTRGR
ncbi:FAD-binding and (Fe-S)-binding domain-containing protein [Georgenia ruanii]|uniref:FAD-binding protein n=1 Tax=Georgenia ruanii TaxID=348442 RepID=A0A7J9UU41_9MICO|nr:FAD-binding and (Fe-S)-binding domain-containing protein [Georgenia ruanii]MPV87843.1 FAD-binding protein [Georgenia ruanii]